MQSAAAAAGSAAATAATAAVLSGEKRSRAEDGSSAAAVTAASAAESAGASKRSRVAGGSSSAAVSSAAASAAPSAWCTLPFDPLSLVCALFSDVREFAASSAVCTEWRRAIISPRMPAGCAHADCSDDSSGGMRMAALAASPFARHVQSAALTLNSEFASNLSLLVGSFAHIQSLTLCAQYRGQDLRAVSFEPVTRLQRLSALILDCSELSMAQLNVCKQLPLLRTLGRGDHAWRLLELSVPTIRPPAMTQLTDVSLRYTPLDARATTILQSLTGLTTLDPLLISADALPLLSAFPRLTSLRVHLAEAVEGALSKVPWAQLAGSLRSLHLGNLWEAAGAVAAVLQSLPLLSSLALAGPTSFLTDYSCLASLAAFESLSLDCAPFFSSENLQQIARVKTLRSLKMTIDASSLIGEEELRMLLQPPSKLMPQLEQWSLESEVQADPEEVY